MNEAQLELRDLPLSSEIRTTKSSLYFHSKLNTAGYKFISTKSVISKTNVSATAFIYFYFYLGFEFQFDFLTLNICFTTDQISDAQFHYQNVECTYLSVL